MKPVDIRSEDEEVLHHLEELEAAENRKDIPGILDLLAEDFVFVYRDAIIEGKANTREMLHESAKDYISSKHFSSRVEVSSSGDIAWLLGYELNQRRRDGEIVETKQNYLITFKKIEGRWKQVVVCLT